jgi:hypothetical protein
MERRLIKEGGYRGMLDAFGIVQQPVRHPRVRGRFGAPAVATRLTDCGAPLRDRARPPGGKARLEALLSGCENER